MLPSQPLIEQVKSTTGLKPRALEDVSKDAHEAKGSLRARKDLAVHHEAAFRVLAYPRLTAAAV